MSNVPVGAGDIRLDWEYFFEGNPDFSVHDTYLPKAGAMITDDGLNTLASVASTAMRSGAVTNVSDTVNTGFMNSIVKGIHAAIDVAGPVKLFVEALLALF